MPIKPLTTYRLPQQKRRFPRLFPHQKRPPFQRPKTGSARRATCRNNVARVRNSNNSRVTNNVHGKTVTNAARRTIRHRNNSKPANNVRRTDNNHANSVRRKDSSNRVNRVRRTRNNNAHNSNSSNVRRNKRRPRAKTAFPAKECRTRKPDKESSHRAPITGSRAKDNNIRNNNAKALFPANNGNKSSARKTVSVRNNSKAVSRVHHNSRAQGRNASLFPANSANSNKVLLLQRPEAIRNSPHHLPRRKTRRSVKVLFPANNARRRSSARHNRRR